MEKKTVENNTEIIRDEVPTLTLEEFKTKVSIKDYITIAEKRAIINTIYSNCVIKDEINNIYYIDKLMEIVCLNLAMLNYCTDFHSAIENADKYTYDDLAKADIFDYLESVTVDLMADVYFSVRMFRERVEAINGVGATIGRILNDVMQKIPDTKDLHKLINKLPKVINNIDKDVIEIFAKEVSNGEIAKVINKSQPINIKDHINKDEK